MIQAVEAQPRHAQFVQGASGFSHPVVALGVDESRRRIVIISGESEARMAAMAQADIQAAMPSTNVVMARPAPINLAQAAIFISELIGRASIRPEELNWVAGKSQEEVQKELDKLTEPVSAKVVPALKSFQFASLNYISIFKEIVQQLGLIEIDYAHESEEQQEAEKGESKIPALHLSRLMAFDPVEVDRRMGVCSVPLYELREDDVEVFHSARDIEHVREILKRHHIFQYFFPAADQLTLGLVEKMNAPAGTILSRLIHVPEIGHPFGQPELLPLSIKMDEIISALQERRLLVEGEIGMQLTEGGLESRATVRFKPREGLLSKLSHVFSVKINMNLRDLFK